MRLEVLRVTEENSVAVAEFQIHALGVALALGVFQVQHHALRLVDDVLNPRAGIGIQVFTAAN